MSATVKAPARPPMEASRYLKFEDFVVDRRARQLRRGDRVLAIQDKPLRLLEALLLADNDVVTHDDLVAALWPDGEYLDHENGIHTAVRKLREVLGDSASQARYVQTVPRVGYRFLVPVAIPLAGRREKLRATPLVAVALAAAAVLTVLVVATTPRALESGARAVTALPRSPAAREAFREARYLVEQPVPGSLDAVTLLAEVIRLEPDFAPAHGTLAEVYTRRAIGDPRCDECVARARDSIEAALALDPDQVDALLARGQIDLLFSWDPEGAEANIRRGVALAPHSATAQLTLGTWLAAVGRRDEAVEAVRRAMDLDPGSFAVRADLGFFLLAAGRNREAARVCERAAALAPEFAPAHRCALLAHTRLGDDARAGAAARRALALAGAEPAVLSRFDSLPENERTRYYWQTVLHRAESSTDAPPFRLAAGHAMLGERARALALLEESYTDRWPLLALLPVFAELGSLHGDPGYEDLVERIGIEEWHHRTEVSRLGSATP